MNRIAVALVAVGLIALAIVGSVTGTAASRPARPVIETTPVTTAQLACPGLDSSTGTKTSATVLDASSALTVPSKSSGTVAASISAGTKIRSTVIKPDPYFVVASAPRTGNPQVFFSALGTVAATMAADQVGETPLGPARALTGVRCEAPAVDWWFAGADGRVGYLDHLTLANPNATAATVTITLWGANGVVHGTDLTNVAVPPRSATGLSLATIAPDVPTVAVHIHATSGSVTAALFDRRTVGLFSAGADYLPATAAPARTALVSGFMNGVGPRTVVIGNPGTLDATVGLKVISQAGSFVPSGQNEVVVKAGQTRAVNVTRALDGQSGAIELTSDQPVIGQGMSVMPGGPNKRSDFMWLAATSPLLGPAPVANGRDPDGGQTLLLLTAPVDAAHVVVTTATGASRTVGVTAGHSTIVNLGPTIAAKRGPYSFVVTPVGSAPVYATRVLTFMGAHGALITSEPLVALPHPLVLPPVRQDPRTAIR